LDVCVEVIYITVKHHQTLLIEHPVYVLYYSRCLIYM